MTPKQRESIMAWIDNGGGIVPSLIALDLLAEVDRLRAELVTAYAVGCEDGMDGNTRTNPYL